MTRGLILFLALVLSVGSASSQKTKPWTEWSKKDAEKTLNDSAWAQTQNESEGTEQNTSSTSAITQVAATGAANREISRSGESGESKPSKLLKYRMRLLSAKPVREAFSRMVVLSQQNAGGDLTQQLQGFIDRDFSDYIIVAVAVETNDKNTGGAIAQLLNNSTADTLKASTYLERSDGKRMPLQEYRAPSTDGMGAKFIFPRTLAGEPFLTDDKDSVRFVAQVSPKLKLTARYKLADMFYNGKVEY